jgi:hypothetical protein
MGGGAGGTMAKQTPWIIAAILVVVTVVGITLSAKSKGAAASQMANAGNAGAGGAPSSDGTGPATIDISKMSLSEQYIKLMNKVTAAAENGDSATVVNFTPMALGAYTNLPPADRDIDARYHAAMLQTNVGMFAAALALADTISKEAPNNLMADYIRIIVAQDQGDSTKAKAERAKFREHFDSELKKKRSEYEAHTEFLQNYRKGAGAK